MKTLLGVYIPIPLRGNWFEMRLNAAGLPHQPEQWEWLAGWTRPELFLVMDLHLNQLPSLWSFLLTFQIFLAVKRTTLLFWLAHCFHIAVYSHGRWLFSPCGTKIELKKNGYRTDIKQRQDNMSADPNCVCEEETFCWHNTISLIDWCNIFELFGQTATAMLI